MATSVTEKQVRKAYNDVRVAMRSPGLLKKSDYKQIALVLEYLAPWLKGK